jgi:uncharacterized membrane protein
MRALSAARRYPLLLCLALQSALLFPHLDLLPIWGDELHTLETIAKPIERSFSSLSREYHPPAYFLLARAWNALPLPGGAVVRLRALSALILLVATALVWRCWIAQLPERARWWYLALWATSPFLILYGRMARSYTLQLALASLTVYFATALVADVSRRRYWIACALSLTSLFYVHYLPAMALLLALGGVLVYRAIRQWHFQFLLALATVTALTALLYSPWILHLTETVGMVANDKPYLSSGARVHEHLLRLAYGAVAFTYGETLPMAVVCVAVLLAPPIAWLLWRGARTAPSWLPLVAVAGLCAYFGAVNSVSFAFIPARLAFIYPFFLLLLVWGAQGRPKAGAMLMGALLLLAPFTLWSYYHRDHFLNKGYVIRYQEIVDSVGRDAPRDRTLVLLDCYGMDPHILAVGLRPRARIGLVRDSRSIERAKKLVSQGSVDTVWLIRAGHDASPARVNDAAQRELSRTLDARRLSFVPYSALDRAVMGWLGWPARPTHVIEAIELFRRQ